ncbi:MAG: FkbM family methyltransferase [Spirochaetes bacterium]|nr:FkbM family methyltransferase [Spirochaetota bacterium]
MNFLKKLILGLTPPLWSKKIAPLIKYKSLRRRKYKGYNPAGGFSYKLYPYVNLVKTWTNINVKNVFEIGANFAQDADFLREAFGLAPKDVYVFEAHPDIFKAVTQIHSFNAYHNAVFNENREIAFNILPLDYRDTGWSSIHAMGHKTQEVKVQAIRMDGFMEAHSVGKIDFLKIDVEGATYEVLEGFGKRLKDVNCIQLEAEHGEVNFPGHWNLYDKIEHILKENDFELALFERNEGMRQSDSFWVQKDCIKYAQL